MGKCWDACGYVLTCFMFLGLLLRGLELVQNTLARLFLTNSGLPMMGNPSFPTMEPATMTNRSTLLFETVEDKSGA